MIRRRRVPSPSHIRPHRISWLRLLDKTVCAIWPMRSSSGAVRSRICLIVSIAPGRHVAVTHVPAEAVVLQEVGDVRRLGPEEQDRPADGHRAVDLAGVDDADHVVAERDDVHVGGAERVAQVRQRLVGERDDVRQVVLRR